MLLAGGTGFGEEVAVVYGASCSAEHSRTFLVDAIGCNAVAESGRAVALPWHLSEVSPEGDIGQAAVLHRVSSASRRDFVSVYGATGAFAQPMNRRHARTF